MLKLTFRLAALVLLASPAFAQDYTLNFSRTRQPVFNVSKYKVIGVGDIVGAAGRPTPSSLNVTDNLDNSFVKQEDHEIVDHNALKQLTGAKGDLITDAALASLAKKNQSSVLVTGRVQSDKVNQGLKTTTSGIANCPVRYWYETFGDFTVQVKVFEAKSAKLVHSELVKVPMVHKSKEVCERPTGGMDEEQIQREAAQEAAVQISHLLFPYEEPLTADLWHPLIGTAFKNSRGAVVLFNSGDHKAALDILAGYAADPNVKDKVKPCAFYNYGVCLYADAQFAAAKEQFLKAYALDPLTVKYKNSANAMDKEIERNAVAAQH